MRQPVSLSKGHEDDDELTKIPCILTINGKEQMA